MQLSEARVKAMTFAASINRKLTFEDREDIAQQAVTAFSISAPANMIRGEAIRLLYVITKNKTLDYLRIKQETEQIDDLNLDGLRSEALSADTYERVLQASRGILSKKQIDMMIMGYSIDEIAQANNITTSALRQRIAKIRNFQKYSVAA